MEYSNENETAVCNLASIALSNFIIETKSSFSNILKYILKIIVIGVY